MGINECCNQDCNQGRDCPLRKTDNEPVAYVDNVWIDRPDLAMDLGIGKMFSRCQLSDHQIPLYTHPAKTPTLVLDGNRVYPAFKTLTDEEIARLIPNIFYMDESYSKNLYDDAMRFARAILRKAQEK
jgi:hypothetical protein